MPAGEQLSHTIGVIVAVILVLAYGIMFLTSLIRGRIESTGFVIDWKTAPLWMVFWLSMMLVSPVIIIVFGLGRGCHAAKRPVAEPYCIYVQYSESEGWPALWYEGPGVERMRFITQDEDGTFHMSYSAMRLPPGIRWELDGINDLPEYRVFEFAGTLAVVEKECVLQGELESRAEGELLVCGADAGLVLRRGKNTVYLRWRWAVDKEQPPQK